MGEVFIAVWGENSHDGYTVAILAAMAFSFSQVQFQHLWFDFHTLILSHILTFHHIHSADSNVSFFLYMLQASLAGTVHFTYDCLH